MTSHNWPLGGGEAEEEEEADQEDEGDGAADVGHRPHRRDGHRHLLLRGLHVLHGQARVNTSQRLSPAQARLLAHNKHKQTENNKLGLHNANIASESVLKYVNKTKVGYIHLSPWPESLLVYEKWI